jgi:hypothetical protein
VPEQVPDNCERRDQQHAHARHPMWFIPHPTPITGYSNATPSGSFSRNHVIAGSGVPWFSALKTPMRANIVGPPYVATSIKASIAACHSAAS